MSQLGELTDDAGRTFSLLRKLGAGGFGEVYLAAFVTPGGLTEYVAVKLLKAELGPGSLAVERLQDEARMLAQLDHPVILVARDLVTIDGRVAMITEYVEGLDLAQLLRSEPRMPPTAVLEVVEKVAGALEEAWEQEGIVHRDIKPQNIRIGVHGNVKLLDFGIARSDDLSREAHTGSHQVLGTIRYIAPERFEAGDVDPASDIFALGCVLYEGWVGSGLFDKLDSNVILRLCIDQPGFESHVQERIPDDLPDDIDELLRGMLDWSAAKRPSASSVARACEAIRHRLANESQGLTLWRYCRTYPWPPSVRRPREAKATRWVRDHHAPAPNPSDSIETHRDPPEEDVVEQTLPEPRPERQPDPPSSPRSSEAGTGSTAMPTGLLFGGCLGASGLGVVLGLAGLAMVLSVLQPRWFEAAPDPGLESRPMPATVPDPAPLDDPAPIPVASPPTPKPGPTQVKPTRPKPVAPRPDPPRPDAPSPDPATAPGTANGPASPSPVPNPGPSAAAEQVITFSSRPLGAQLMIDGQSHGSTARGALRVPLEAGRQYRIQMLSANGASPVSRITVGRNQPNLFTWNDNDRAWTAGYR